MVKKNSYSCAMKMYGDLSYSSTILKLSTKEKAPPYPQYKRLGAPQSQLLYWPSYPSPIIWQYTFKKCRGFVCEYVWLLVDYQLLNKLTKQISLYEVHIIYVKICTKQSDKPVYISRTVHRFFNYTISIAVVT